MNSPALPRIPRRDAVSHKGDFGKVLLIGGSRGMAGSISLSASAAIRAGSGLVTVAVPDRCLETVAGFDRCYMTIGLADDTNGFHELAASRLAKHAEPATVIGCGPGMRTGIGSQRIIKFLCSEMKGKPRVLDADALNCLAKFDDWRSLLSENTILTPHPGEWARLCEVNAGNRDAQKKAATEIAKATGATIVLKGSATYVTNGDHSIENKTGNPGMATGGSGDVLTGIVAGLLAQGLLPFDAAHLAVNLHGTAGDLAAEAMGEISMNASDVLAYLPAAFLSLDGG